MNHNMHQTFLPVCIPSREMKMEKRSCSGIARVTPSSHMGASSHPTSTAGNKAGLSHLTSFTQKFPTFRWEKSMFAVSQNFSTWCSVISMIVKQPPFPVPWIKNSPKLRCIEMYFRRAASRGGCCSAPSPRLYRQQLVLRLLQLFLLPTENTTLL